MKGFDFSVFVLLNFNKSDECLKCAVTNGILFSPNQIKLNWMKGEMLSQDRILE